jgi:hypothetical protein
VWYALLSRKMMEPEEREVHAIIARDFSASVMNNTKWRELANALKGLPLAYRIKWVDVAEPKPLGGIWSATDRHFDTVDFGPFLTLSIEWLDIIPNVQGHDHVSAERAQEDVEVRLRAVSIPFHREGNSIRVTGHVRSEQA